MIIFKNIDITSFKSIYHCYLDFENLNNDLYLLEGINNTVNFASSNGSGKSTLVSAIMFALYGSTDIASLKIEDYQNKNTNIKLCIKLNLSIQNINYTIERTNKEFKLYKEDEDISELTKTDTEKKFQTILNLSKSEFNTFTYVSQNNNNFLTKTPSEKLTCIKDFIFGDEFINLQNKITDLIKKVKKDIEIETNKLSSIEGKLSILKQQIEKSEIIYPKLPYTQEEYKSLVKELKQKQEIDTKQRQLQKDYEYQKTNLKAQFQNIKNEHEKVQQNICPTCGQKLLDNTVIDNLRQKAKIIKQTAIDINEKLENISKSLLSDEEYQNLKVKIQEYTNNIYQLEQQKSISQNITENKLDYNKLITEQVLVNQTIDNLSFKLQQLNKLNSYFKTNFVQYIQQNFLKEIENYLNLYCYSTFDNDFKLNFNNNTLDILVGNHSINYYSGGEIQKLNVIFLFAIKVAISDLTNKATNLLILDESLSGSDSEAFENTLDMISSLTKSSNLTTILISHRDINYEMNKIVINRFENKTELNII